MSGGREGRTVETPSRLVERLNQVYESLGWLRELAYSTMREYAGRHYGRGEATRREKNRLHEAINGLRPTLAIDDPRAIVTPADPARQLEADILKRRLDRRIVETNLEREVDAAVEDCILGGGVGVLFVSERASHDQASLETGEVWIGESYVQHIPSEQCVFDPEARHDGEAAFQAHRFRVSRALAVALRAFGRDPELPPDPTTGFPGAAAETEFEDVLTRDEAAEVLSRLTSYDKRTEREPLVEWLAGQEEPRPTDDVVELWYAVLFEGEEIYSVVAPVEPTGNSTHKWLVKERFSGPEGGPYVNLRLLPIRNNLVGLSFAASLRDLHDAEVRLGQKTVRELLRVKNLGVYTAGAEDEALNLAQAAGGTMNRVPDAKAVGNLQLGGVPEDFYRGLGWLGQEANNLTGHLSLITGGRAEPRETATATNIAAGGAQLRVGAMRRAVYQFSLAALRKLAWHEWYHPLNAFDGRIETPFGPVPVSVTAADREGDDLDDHFDIGLDLSTQAESELAIRQRSIQTFMQLFMSVFPFVQGGLFDLRGLLSIARGTFGVRDIDLLIPDVQRAMQMALMGPMVGGGLAIMRGREAAPPPPGQAVQLARAPTGTQPQPQPPTNPFGMEVA